MPGPHLLGDDWRIRAILNFAGEEAKHIHLFKRFHQAFVRGFPVECQMIGPSEAIGAEMLKHDPLAVGLVILMIEWMSQQHYLGSIRDDGDIDPLFKSLLKNHWMEEAQHAKLDTLIVDALAVGRTEDQIDKAIDEFFEIGAFLDEGLKPQADFNLDALEKAIGRKVEDREEIMAQQHQAARWTYIGSGMVHERFQDTLTGSRAAPPSAWPRPLPSSPESRQPKRRKRMLDTVKNERVNGLDLKALGEVVEAIGEDASKAKVAFSVTTKWAGQTAQRDRDRRLYDRR